MPNPSDNSWPARHEHQPSLSRKNFCRLLRGCEHTIRVAVAVGNHHALALVIPEHLIDLPNHHLKPLASPSLSTARGPNLSHRVTWRRTAHWRPAATSRRCRGSQGRFSAFARSQGRVAGPTRLRTSLHVRMTLLKTALVGKPPEKAQFRTHADEIRRNPASLQVIRAGVLPGKYGDSPR
jgi:hypothetical protein